MKWDIIMLENPDIQHQMIGLHVKVKQIIGLL
jgi:hypothetical protein